PSMVWDSDFESVQHFDGNLLDATSHGTNGTDHGSTDHPAGQIIGARAFTPNNYVDMGSGVLPDEQHYTISAWVNAGFDGSDSECKYIMDASRSALPYDGSALGVRRNNGAVC